MTLVTQNISGRWVLPGQQYRCDRNDRRAGVRTGMDTNGWPGPSGQGFKAWRMLHNLAGDATLEYRDRQPWMARTLWSVLQGLDDASISGRGCHPGV